MPASEEVESGDAKRGKSVVQLMLSFFESSKAYEWRFGMWESSWEAMKAHPEGGGAGNWRVIYPAFVTQREKNDMFNIANRYNVAAVSPLFTNAGQPTASYDPRQFQFALKLNW